VAGAWSRLFASDRSLIKARYLKQRMRSVSVWPRRMLGSFLDITTMMITNRGDGRSPECSPDRPEAEPLEAAARSERILVLVPGGADAALIREVLTRARLKYSLCADMDELCAQMHSDAGAVLLAEEVLDPSVMQRLVEIVGQQPPWSDFPFAVLF